MKTLILPKFSLSAPVEDYDIIIRLDDKYTEPEDILCFIPNRQITSRANQNFAFIAYGPNSWDYKQASRSIGCQIGDGKFCMLDTNLTWPLHKEVGLNHNEELNILMLTTMFFLTDEGIGEKLDITLYERVPLLEKEDIYLNKLISDKRITILN